MSAFFNAAVARAVGLGLLHSLWQDALIAVALALALRAIDRKAAALRHWLACLALVLMVAVPGATAWASYRPEAAVSPPLTMKHLSFAQLGALDRTPAPAEAPQISTARRLEVPDSSFRWIVFGWLLGVGFSAARLLSDAIGVHRVASLAVPAPEQWQIRLDRMARRIGVRPMVTLLRSDKVPAPCAIGWLKPMILVPGSAFTGLAPQDLELVLAHELAHIARSDFALNIAQRICESLLFFHPAAHWASGVIRAERENCCDDIAVRSANPVAYARALTELEALRIGMHAIGSAARATVSALGGSLTERVKRLVLPQARCGSRRIAGASAFTVLGTLAVVAPLAVGAIAHAKPEPAMVELRTSGAAPFTVRSTPGSTLVFGPNGGPVLAQVIRAPHGVKPFVVHASPTPAPSPSPRPDPKVAGTTPRPDESDPEIEVAEADVDVETPEPDVEVESDEKLSRAEELVQLKDAGITPEYIQKLRAAGLKPTTRELVMLGNAGVSADDVAKYDKLFGKQLSARELAALKNEEVTPEFVESIRKLGFKDFSLHTLIGARSVGVDEKYVEKMKAAGLEPKSLRELVQLRSVGVDADYIAQMKKAGLQPLDARSLSQMRAVGVDPEFVEQMRKAGLQPLDVHSLTQLRAVGVDPDFIAQMKKAGLQSLDVHSLTQLRAVGVDPEFIAQMKKLGLDPLSVHELTQLRSVGVSPEYVESLRKAGLTHLTAEQLFHLKASGVDPQFADEMNRASPQ